MDGEVTKKPIHERPRTLSPAFFSLFFFQVKWSFHFENNLCGEQVKDFSPLINQIQQPNKMRAPLPLLLGLPLSCSLPTISELRGVGKPKGDGEGEQGAKVGVWGGMGLNAFERA